MATDDSYFIGMPVFFLDVDRTNPKAMYDALSGAEDVLRGNASEVLSRDLTSIPKGDLTAERDLYSILRGNVTKLQQAYTRSLDINPSIEGQRAIEYIDFIDSELESALAIQAKEKCLRGSLK